MKSVWIRKYSPKNLKEFVNQKEGVASFLKWYKNWNKEKKPCIIYGPPGCGKTSFVYAFAKENGLDVIEINASDFRDAENIKRVMKPALQQTSLFGNKKIFLVDEVDGISGKEDRGGTTEILKLVKEAKFPVVFTANDVWNPKLRGIREISHLIQFKKIGVRDIEKRLKEILQREEIEFEEAVVKQIAARNEGDLRGAINDLELVARGKKKLTVTDLESIGFRDREQNVFDTVKIIFKTKSLKSSRFAIMNSEKDPEEIFWWIENNIFNEYEKPDEIEKAYEFLSRADLFRRRVSLRQNWRLIVYMIDLIAAVSVAKKEMYRKFTKYSYPERLKILSTTKYQREEEMEKLKEIAKKLHCSVRKVKKEFLPYINILQK